MTAPTAAPAIDLAALRRRVDALPALPQAAMDALAALRAEGSTPEQCAGQISRDQALAARTLRLANSAFYGLAGRVASVRDAVHMLGRRTLGSMVTAAVVSDQIRADQCEGFDFSAFWRHAFATATAARLLAQELRLDEELAVTSGLLHDIGQLVMAAYFPVEFGEVLAQARRRDEPLFLTEASLGATDHAELGAMIVAHWNLPAPVAEAVRRHHWLGNRAGADAPVSVADAVHIADCIAHALDLSCLEHEMVPEIDLATGGRLGLKPAQYLRTFDETEQGVASLCHALGL